MNVVAYGGETNSTAMLVGMYERGIPVDLILFADPGGEQPYTYEYLPIMDDWLARHGMPRLQTVYCTDKNGNRLTLEQECLRSGTLPAIAYGYKKCSLKHKIAPQEKFCNNYPPCREVWARGEKVAFLLEQAGGCVHGLSPSFHGEMAAHAFLDHCHIAREIIKQCTNEQIAAAPPLLLELFAAGPDYEMLSTLVEKGISGGGSAARTLHMLTYEGRNSWIAEELLEKRMWVDPNNYGALHACVENGAVDVAKLLLDGGMDFDQYRQRFPGSGSPDTIQALEEHWQTIQEQAQKLEQEQADAPGMGGGMALG